MAQPVNRTSDVELGEAEFFRALPAERLDEVRRLLSERRFEARKALFFEGEPADHLWLVRRGEVRELQELRRRPDHHARVAGPGPGVRSALGAHGGAIPSQRRGRDRRRGLVSAP